MEQIIVLGITAGITDITALVSRFTFLYRKTHLSDKSNGVSV